MTTPRLPKPLPTTDTVLRKRFDHKFKGCAQIFGSDQTSNFCSNHLLFSFQEMEEESNYQASVKLPHNWSQQKWIGLDCKRGFKSGYSRALDGGCGVVLVVEKCEPLTLNLPLDHKTGQWWMGQAPGDAFCWSSTSLEDLYRLKSSRTSYRQKAAHTKRP